ncbi:hypothetical protein L2E82_50841 [Cichorium intybus]|nr:hypothetical protein L2E82_50841 [Cichorium intybus]
MVNYDTGDSLSMCSGQEVPMHSILLSTTAVTALTPSSASYFHDGIMGCSDDGWYLMNWEPHFHYTAPQQVSYGKEID